MTVSPTARADSFGVAGCFNQAYDLPDQTPPVVTILCYVFCGIVSLLGVILMVIMPFAHARALPAHH